MSHKKTVSLAARALAGALIASASFAAGAKEITQIRFAVDPSYPPFESKLADGTLAGFDIDLGNALCAEMKVKCVWVENNFDGMIPGLKARKFDAVLSDMGITEERLKQIDFTDPLYDTHAQLVARAGSGILPTPQSLKGKRVGVEQGSVQERYAKLKWEPQGATVVPYADQEQVETDLVAGRIDAMFTDAAQAAIGFLKKPQGKPFALVGTIVEDKAIIGPGTAIGLRKGDAELKQGLNQAFANMKKNGTFKRIMAKYFATDVSVQ
ncbi:ABC transporter substrate-binding protein [Caballeronia telluris]|jgi:lysine/arginine/ornithine transport system substrate-binding protein|uniref:Amino acid ABC transporter periplasmic amino acid-binding protein n=1 Tax=Caballeronia telluris TaxID=326475 RepID=A0A158KAC6_9BURK|nr:ABC transporter substrate-binding protein [Caballeronia telluris]SAL77739.1 amino acid ABC transporter periplasmic amino acid-binding protein [Caballeronia telluris]